MKFKTAKQIDKRHFLIQSGQKLKAQKFSEEPSSFALGRKKLFPFPKAKVSLKFYRGFEDSNELLSKKRNHYKNEENHSTLKRHLYIFISIYKDINIFIYKNICI